MKMLVRSFWLVGSLAAIAALGAGAQQKSFQVEEASIIDIQNAIKSGQTTCKQVVQAYLVRAKAYNGVCTQIVTRDGAPIPAATGMMRAGSLVKYPTQTEPISDVFPNFDQYSGLPFEMGQMVTSASDPTVKLQYGLRVGISEAGQLNAIETLNIRGERSITCKGEFDKNPADGPLPAGAPAVCEEFRKMPDAVERAAELDKRYGKNPDLKALPMYCAVMSMKNWYDAKDIRSMGGNDVNFAMDAPKYDSPDIALLREKGAIIYASTTANSTGGPSAQGPQKSKFAGAMSNLPYGPTGDMQWGPWGGQACNPYDTTRVPRGTSNGSAVSVSANLTTCSICEQTSASCKGPASRNGIVVLLPTKGVHMDGGYESKNAGDRAGIHCKTMKDAALVMDAVKGYEREDSYTALPKGLIPEKPFAGFLVSDTQVKDKPLKGMRVALVREFMVKHTKNDVAISDQIDNEVKDILRDKLGAEIVESSDPMYPDDPSVANMKYTFRDAMAEILPRAVPEFFFQKDSKGKPIYEVPGWDVMTVDYDVALITHKAQLSNLINIRTIAEGRFSNPSTMVNMNEYLAKRGDTRVKDWATWVANAKFKTDEERVRAENAVGNENPRAAGNGIPYLTMQAIMRMIILKVMYENKIDVFVNPEQTTPPDLLGRAPEPDMNGRPSRSCCTGFTALIGGPEADVPAGFVTTVYNPTYELSADKKTYSTVAGTVESKLPHPMPISMMFWSGPGSDADVIKVASAYEAATHHRTPPPSFGPVPGERK